MESDGKTSRKVFRVVRPQSRPVLHPRLVLQSRKRPREEKPATEPPKKRLNSYSTTWFDEQELFPAGIPVLPSSISHWPPIQIPGEEEEINISVSSRAPTPVIKVNTFMHDDTLEIRDRRHDVSEASTPLDECQCTDYD